MQTEIYGCALQETGPLVHEPHLNVVNPRLCRGLSKFDSSGSLPFVVFAVVGFDFAIAVRPL